MAKTQRKAVPAADAAGATAEQQSTLPAGSIDATTPADDSAGKAQSGDKTQAQAPFLELLTRLQASGLLSSEVAAEILEAADQVETVLPAPTQNIGVVVVGSGWSVRLDAVLNAFGEYIVTLPVGSPGPDIQVAPISGDVEGLFIRSVSDKGFRRGGMRFSPEGHGVALSALTYAQIQALVQDPNLIVEPSTFTDQAQD